MNRRPNSLRTQLTSSTGWFGVAILVCSICGCGANPYFASQNGPWPGTNSPAVATNEAQISELNRRIRLLDDNNRQLTTQLAQSEQQAQVFREENELYRKQLADMTQRLDAANLAAKNAQDQVQGFQASARSRGGAIIRPNTNLGQLASQLNLGGLAAEQDGDVVRIIVPADRLFQPGTTQLQAQAATTIESLGAQLTKVFPRQRIGIEGYTDNAQLFGGSAATSQQLSSGQALLVFDLMTKRLGMPAEQLFTVAQGANNPRQPNDTAAGRAANRRIEIVIYPDTF